MEEVGIFFMKNTYINKNVRKNSELIVNTSIEGETIEMKVERITVNREPISDGAPMIYTERKEGVLAGYDIRTDRFEIAIEAMDKVSKTNQAKREERGKVIDINKSENVGDEPTQATNKE